MRSGTGNATWDSRARVHVNAHDRTRRTQDKCECAQALWVQPPPPLPHPPALIRLSSEAVLARYTNAVTGKSATMKRIHSCSFQSTPPKRHRVRLRLPIQSHEAAAAAAVRFSSAAAPGFDSNPLCVDFPPIILTTQAPGGAAVLICRRNVAAAGRKSTCLPFKSCGRRRSCTGSDLIRR